MTIRARRDWVKETYPALSAPFSGCRKIKIRRHERLGEVDFVRVSSVVWWIDLHWPRITDDADDQRRDYEKCECICDSKMDAEDDGLASSS